VQILERALPPAPAAVADVGGGPGRYSVWLAERGYTVHDRDLVPLHVEQVTADAVAPRLHGEVAERLTEESPSIRDAAELVEGRLSGYCHRPDELREEIPAAGLDLVDLVGVEGIAFALSDLGERLAEPAQREIVLDAARTLERIPELLGASRHLLATARRPRLVLE
jgi:hypothetical protein